MSWDRLKYPQISRIPSNNRAAKQGQGRREEGKRERGKEGKRERGKEGKRKRKREVRSKYDSTKEEESFTMKQE